MNDLEELIAYYTQYVEFCNKVGDTEEAARTKKLLGLFEELKDFKDSSFSPKQYRTAVDGAYDFGYRRGMEEAFIEKHQNTVDVFAENLYRKIADSQLNQYKDTVAAMIDETKAQLKVDGESVVESNSLYKDLMAVRRKNEIQSVLLLCEQIGYGNAMDIASALWTLKAGSMHHVPTVAPFLTKDGLKHAKENLDFRLSELESLGFGGRSE